MLSTGLLPAGSAAARSFFAFTVTRPIAVSMVVLAICVFGLVGLLGLPVNLLPDVSYPSVTLSASLTVGDCSNWCYYAMEASACMMRVRMLRSGGCWATSP